MVDKRQARVAPAPAADAASSNSQPAPDQPQNQQQQQPQPQAQTPTPQQVQPQPQQVQMPAQAGPVVTQATSTKASIVAQAVASATSSASPTSTSLALPPPPPPSSTPLNATLPSPSSDADAPAANGFHWQYLIPVAAVVGVLLLATLLGKCWGVWSLHNDRKDERRKKHERKLAGVPTLRRGPMAEISYETSGRDFFLGKSNAQYETRRGGSNFPNPPRDGRLPPGYGKGYSAGGNIPTTRNRAGRFEAGLQTNQWWKVKLQRAFGSSSAPDEKYTEFPESYAMTERRESADVNDQAEVVKKTSWFGNGLRRQRSFSPTSYERRHLSLLDRATETASGLVSAVKGGPNSLLSWISSGREQDADESMVLLGSMGSPLKSGADDLPFCYSPPASPTKRSSIPSPILLTSTSNMSRAGTIRMPPAVLEDDGFIDSPLSSPSKKSFTEVLRFGSPPASPSVLASPASKYTCSSWGRSAVTSNSTDSPRSTITTNILRRNTMANSEVPSELSETLSKRAIKKNQSVRISATVENINTGLTPMLSPGTPKRAEQEVPSRASTLSMKAPLFKGGVPSVATADAELEKSPLDRQDSTSSRATNSSVSSAATMVDTQPVKVALKSSIKAIAPTITHHEMQKISSFATEIVAMMAETSVEIETPTRKATRLRVAGNLEKTDESPKSRTPTKDSVVPRSNQSVPHALVIASPSYPVSPSFQGLQTVAPTGRSQDLFFDSPATTYGSSTPPRKRGADPAHSRSLTETTATSPNQPTRARTMIIRKKSSGTLKKADSPQRRESPVVKVKTPVQRARAHTAAMSKVQAIVATQGTA